MSTKQEQELFWQWINQPRDLAEHADAIAEVLAPHSHLSQAEALSIYNNAYHQRLVEISSSLYPVLFHTLGKDLHTRLWLGYMSKYPPRNGPINRVGLHLHAYVSTDEQFHKLPAAADIIELETLLITLFDVVDEPALTVAQLQAMKAEDWPATRWRAKQDWALRRSRFDLQKYWQLMQEFMASGLEPGTAPFGVELTTRPDYLVYRRQLRMQFQGISPEFALFLQAIQDGDTFAQICERLSAAFPAQDIPQLSLTLLLRAIELELLCPLVAPSS